MSERVDWVGREPGRVAYLWIDGRTGSAKADREVSLSIHRGATHPAPGSVRLIGALLINGHRSGRHVAQLKPAYCCDAPGADSIVAYDGLVAAEVPIGESKHQTVTDAIQVTIGGNPRLRHTRASGGAEGGKARRGW